MREGSRKVIETEINELCENGQRNVFGEMLLDEFGHALLLPRRQAAANWPSCAGFRSFQSEELARCGHGLSSVGFSCEVHRNDGVTSSSKPSLWLATERTCLPLGLYDQSNRMDLWHH
jgi:hypothetical protein